MKKQKIGKKAEMVAFLKDHVELLQNVEIVATGTTGGHVEQSGLNVDKKAYLSALAISENILLIRVIL